MSATLLVLSCDGSRRFEPMLDTNDLNSAFLWRLARRDALRTRDAFDDCAGSEMTLRAIA